MIRHMVLFFLHDGIANADPRVTAAVEAEETLSSEIPDGRDWRFGPNLSARAPAADFVGVGDFESSRALQRFLQHSAHTGVAALWEGLATWTVADLELDHLARARADDHR